MVGLETAAAALRAEHNRLLNRTHFPVPEDSLTGSQPDGEAVDTAGTSLDQEADEDARAVSDQQRMAI